MQPIEALTELDKKRIRNYINVFACPDGDTNPESLEHILRFWNDNKNEYLWELFNHQLILNIPIEYKQSPEEIQEIVEEELNRHEFLENIQNVYPRGSDEWYNVRYALSPSNLATNSIALNCTYRFPLPNGKDYKCQDGTKPMRLARKLAAAFNISGFEDFCNKHSQCLNQKSLKGDLCLSIHPLDYMSMSDNASNWETCMSWENDGEYKQGTIEMMNSPCVVVGYLKSKCPFCFGGNSEDGTWVDKRWRCLFIVDRDFILSVKNYPYQNNHLTQEVIRQFCKIAGWERAKPHLFKRNTSQFIDGNKVYLSLCTGCMYNDFGSTDHYIAINPNCDHDIVNTTYSYSGPSMCIWCGGTDQINGEHSLCCCDCDPQYYCEECGDRISNGDVCTFDGQTFCSCCYNELITYCPITEKDVWRDETVTIYLSCSNEDYILPKLYWRVREIAIDENATAKDWQEIFKLDSLRVSEDEQCYVCPKDCTDEGLSLFCIYDDTDLERYMKQD